MDWCNIICGIQAHNHHICSLDYDHCRPHTPHSSSLESTQPLVLLSRCWSYASTLQAVVLELSSCDSPEFYQVANSSYAHSTLVDDEFELRNRHHSTLVDEELELRNRQHSTLVDEEFELRNRHHSTLVDEEFELKNRHRCSC